MTRFVLASTNQGKVRELNRLFDSPHIELVSLKDVLPDDFEVDETGSTFEENAWLKAIAVCQATGLPALADDSGLEVDALDQRPGVYSARYAGIGAGDAANNALLLQELADIPKEHRAARFVCALVLAVPGEDGQAVQVAQVRGTIEGRILHAPQGENGFGYDPLFEPGEYPGKTTAEISPEQKNAISHRGKAARALLPHILRWLGV